MKAGDKERLGTVRLILSAVKQSEVDTGEQADNAAIVGILDKMVKQRRDSLQQFSAAGRDDLAQKESRELDVIQAYLPEPVSADEIGQLIEKTIAAVGASGMRDMGKVMASIKPALQGRADMGQVSAQVKSRLSAA